MSSLYPVALIAAKAAVLLFLTALVALAARVGPPLVNILNAV